MKACLLKDLEEKSSSERNQQVILNSKVAVKHNIDADKNFPKLLSMNQNGLRFCIVLVIYVAAAATYRQQAYINPSNAEA